MVPEGERWVQCIANRVFKTRVIDLVLLRLPGLLLTGQPNRRLIVDYQQPVEYRFAEGMVRRETLEELPALGEADLKFARFADRFGKLLVDSIDGDSIPIALMHHELCLRRGAPPPVVSVYRMELNREKPASSKKRGRETGGEEEPAKPAARAPRSYEYVNIHALYEGLRDAIAQGTGRIRMPSHAGHEITMLVALIALTGTDFSRNLPQMSGRTVFSWLPDIWPALMQAYLPDGATVGRLEQSRATDQLVALLYRTKFPKHVVRTGSLQAVLEDLRGSGISERVKQTLPSYERVACTVRNANWVLAYWTCEPAPDPVQPEYGFRLLPGGCTEYADLCAEEAGH